MLRLVGLAVCAAAYLAYAVCWTVAVLRTPYGPEAAFPALLHGLGEVLAVVAAPAWFAACLFLPRTASQRAAWLGVGLVVLVPLPLVIGVP